MSRGSGAKQEIQGKVIERMQKRERGHESQDENSLKKKGVLKNIKKTQRQLVFNNSKTKN